MGLRRLLRIRRAGAEGRADHPEAREIADRIRPHFDCEFYRKDWGDLQDPAIDPVLHYVEVGASEGRNPTEWFDTREYLAAHPDVDLARENPFLHFLENRGSGDDGCRIADGLAETEFDPDVVAAVRREFDPEHYVSEWNDLREASFDLVTHYLQHGASEGRNPAPWFSTRYYLSANPDVAAQGLNPFAHYLMFGRNEGRAPTAADVGPIAAFGPQSASDRKARMKAYVEDVTCRLESGALGDMIAKAAEIDPLVRFPSRPEVAVKVPPCVHGAEFAVAAMRRAQSQASKRPAQAVVCIPHCRMSGAARVAGELSHALSDQLGVSDVLVVRTDLAVMEHPEWFPDGIRMVDLASCAAPLPAGQRKMFLFQFLRSLNPHVVFNVNSRLMWDTYLTYGRAMNPAFRTYAYLFCADLNAQGHEAGYPVEMFYRTYDSLAGILTDSRSLEQRLRSRFSVGSGDPRLRAVPTPVRHAPEIAAVPPETGTRRRCVFWAGRFDRQKRVDLVFALASQMPDVDFRLWGRPVLDTAGVTEPPPNVALMGTYDSFADLPLQDCDAWLYTSMWDGVPTILLDVAAAAIPLVGSLVGGTGEVLRDGLSARIAPIDDLDAYKAALNEIFADTRAARNRALRQRDLVLSERTFDRYRDTVASLPGVLRDAS